MRVIFLLPLAVFAIAASVVRTSAAGDFTAYETETGFDLYLARYDIVLDASRPTIDTTVEQIGFALFSRLNSAIDGALILGYSFASRDNAVATAGMDLSGFHAGLALRAPLFRAAGTRVNLDMHYRYDNVDDALDSQSARIAWHGYDVGLSVDQSLTTVFGIHGAVRYGGVSGTETLSGTITRTTSFHSGGKGEGVAGVYIDTGEGGRIAVHARSGRRDGVELVFSRIYD